MSPRAPHVLHPMDVMRPSQLFAVPSAASAPEPRRWLRLMLATLGSAIALLPFVGAGGRPSAGVSALADVRAATTR